MRRRFLQSAFVCLLAFFMLGAGAPSTTFDKLGHQLMCQCGCGQILLECNHVGCPVSGPMIEELKAQVGSGKVSGGVLQWFVDKYGPVVLAAPIRGGFDTAAWIVPFAVLALGIAAVVLLIRLWHRRHEGLIAAPGASAQYAGGADASLRERIRRETDLP